MSKFSLRFVELSSRFWLGGLVIRPDRPLLLAGRSLPDDAVVMGGISVLIFPSHLD